MFPELFELPFIHVTIKSFGVMMVIGFLAAVFLMRRLMRHDGQNPDHITNVALCCLIFGVIGSRIFYVVHHYSQFKGDFFSVFAVWSGGLEYLGGVILAMLVVLGYLLFRRLPVHPSLPKCLKKPPCRRQEKSLNSKVDLSESR